MRIRTFLTGMVLLATVFSGCRKEIPEIVEDIPMGNTVIEVPNPYAHGKTHYQNGAVKWNAGDQIAVARGNGSFARFTIINSTINQDPVKFTGDLDDTTMGGNYYAVYPYMEGITVMNGIIRLPQAIRSTQTLTPGGFGNGDNIMVGMSSTTEMFFRNVGGLIKISLQGTNVQMQSITIKSTFTGPAGKMSGPASINMFDSEPTIAWNSTGCDNKITAVSETGVDLSNGCTFYLVAPPMSEGVYMISMKDMLGNTINFSNEDYAYQELSVARASITNIGNYNVTADWDPDKIYFTTTNDTLDEELKGRFEALGSGCVFYGANGIYSVSYSNVITSLPEEAFMYCETLKSIILPNTITGFAGMGHFDDCSNLQSVRMPDNSSFRTIPNCCFRDCTHLRNINIPSSVTKIDYDVFLHCVYLTVIDLPAGLTTIGAGAFSYTNIATITFPEGLTSIGKEAFEGCRELSSVTCAKTTPISLGVDAFYSISGNAVLRVPASAVSAYQNSDWAQYFGGIEEIM